MGINREVMDETLVLKDTETGKDIEIRETVEEGCMTISPKGDLSTSIAHDLEDELTSAVLVCRNVTLDMGEVSSISNSVIRMLLDVQHVVDSVDGELKLRDLEDGVMSQFREMGLEAVFDIEE